MSGSEHIGDSGAASGSSRRSFLKYAAAIGAGTALAGSFGGLAPHAGAARRRGTGVLGHTSGFRTQSVPEGVIDATAAFTLSSGFDPMSASSAVATAINAHIMEGLIDLDPITREPYLALAKEEPVASEDGLTWTATLRDGAVFSDGTPVTAEDVAWSFTRALDPANTALMAGFISFIDTVTATDDTTVEFSLKTPFSLFAQRIAVIKIVPKALTGDADASTAFDTAPIGSGPYQLVSADSTTGVVIAANPAYNGSRPALAGTINYRTAPDAVARVNDLLGGQSSAIEAVPYLDVASVEGQYTVEEKQAFNQLFLMFNCSAEPFSDKRVRQALHFAIDKDALITTALQGYGTAATSYLDEGNASFQEAATVYGYDPDKATALLEEAGVTDLSFELVTTDTAFIKDCAPVIVEAWKQIGVNATLNTNPSSAVYGEIVPSDDFRVLAASGDPAVFGPDADLLLRWFYYGTTWPIDRQRWTAPEAAEAAELIDTAATQSGDEQMATWKQVLDLVAEEVPLYPVVHVKIVTAHDPDALTGFAGAPTTGLYFLDVAPAG